MARSRFRVVGRIDRASGIQAATVVIERESLLMTVRPLRRRRTYTLYLGDVATMIAQAILRAELREKREAKRRARRERRRR